MATLASYFTIPRRRTRKKEREYEGEVFLLQADEGSNFKDFEVRHFTACTLQENIDATKQVYFFAKVIGMGDKRAPMRNWGMTIKGFIKKYFRRSK